MTIKINNITIGDELIQKEFEYLCKSYKERLSDEEFQNVQTHLQNYAKENIIVRTILDIEANKRIQAIDANEVETEFQKMVDFYGGKEAFEKRFSADSVNEQSIKTNIMRSIKVDKLLSEICKDLEAVSDIEVNRYYEANRSKMLMPDRARVFHILFQLTDMTREEAIEKAVEVRENISSIEDFESFARELSDCPSAELGGDLGVIKRGDTEEGFENEVFEIDEAICSEPVFTSHGVHLIWVETRKLAGVAEIDEVEPRIRQELEYSRKNEIIKNWVSQQRITYSIIES